MIDPSIAKYVIAFFVLAGIGMLFQAGQFLLNPAEFSRRQEEERERERERKRRAKKRADRLQLGCLSVLLVVLGLAQLTKWVSAWQEHNTFLSARVPRPSRVIAPPPEEPPAPPPLEPLVEGRPAHLLGRMADGCRLLTAQEATTLLGRPLTYDAFSLLLLRDDALHCAFVDPAARSPRRSLQEVSLQVLHLPGEAPENRAAVREEDLRWMSHDLDEGMSVTLPTGRGMRLRVRVSLRHLKRQPEKRKTAEREAARRIAFFVQNRVPHLPVEAAPPVRPAPGPGPLAGAWFPTSSEDVVWQDFLPARTREALLDSLYGLRARFGTRVQVVVLDEKRDPGVAQPEVMLRALERTFAVGQADTSPRRDGALVLIDPARRMAWCSFGPAAPPLMSSGRRPFPTEWKGKDLSLQGPGIARRVQGLTAAYTRAYAKLGIEGPPALAAATP